jgi:minor fimbrial subunit
MMKKLSPVHHPAAVGLVDERLVLACKTATGATIPIGGGSANVYVNLTPAVNVGQNLVVDLSTQIFCHNDYPETITDYVTLQRGSAYGGVLSSFSGTVKYNGTSYPSRPPRKRRG